MIQGKRHRQQGGKLIVTRYFDSSINRISFVKHRTRLQRIGNKTILHYDQIR